jgi:hypothetical protein
MLRMIDTLVRIVYCVLSHSCSFIYGCLLRVVTLAKPVTSNIYYTDYGMEQIYEELGEPDIFVLDTAPIFRLLVICSPMIAEQISKASSQYPYSVPKSWTVGDLMPLIGKQSIISSEVRIGFLLDGIMLTIS